jgi:hypothetical protein
VLIESNYETRLHNSRSRTPLSLDEFLSPEEETIVNKDEDILTSVINHYLGKEEELSNKKEVKKVDTTKALKAVKTVKIRKL